jgi:hypothetical protein
VETILSERRQRLLGPHQPGSRPGHPRFTVYRVLRRHGLSRLSDPSRTTRKVIRYRKERPGELLPIDAKRLARIPRHIQGVPRICHRP